MSRSHEAAARISSLLPRAGVAAVCVGSLTLTIVVASGAGSAGA